MRMIRRPARATRRSLAPDKRSDNVITATTSSGRHHAYVPGISAYRTISNTRPLGALRDWAKFFSKKTIFPSQNPPLSPVSRFMEEAWQLGTGKWQLAERQRRKPHDKTSRRVLYSLDGRAVLSLVVAVASCQY